MQLHFFLQTWLSFFMADMDPDMSGRDCAMGCCETQNICFLHSFLLHIEAGSLF